MTTSKTLRLKKPLDIIQQTRPSQVLNLSLWKEKPNKGSADNKNYKNNGNKKSETAKAKEKKSAEEERARAYFKKKVLLEAVDWLCANYPNCFSREAPKPLSVGIFNDILLEGQWPYSKTALRKTLGFYTGSPVYQKAIIDCHKRCSLSGEESQDIAEFEKENSMQKLQSWEERTKKRKLKNNRSNPRKT